MSAATAPTPAELKEHMRIMRELRQQGQAAVTWGLPNPASEAAVLGMGLIMRDKLADAAANDRASEAAALAAGMLDRTVQKMPQAPAYECVKGCSFCCNGAVSVSAPETFRIAGLMAATPGFNRDDVLARAKARKTTTFEAALTLRTPCPLLVDDSCSVYESRPMGCRQFVSTSLQGCRSAFEAKSNLPYVPAAANAGLVVRSLLLSAVASLGLKPETYELSSAMIVVLAEPDAETRWLNGEDVFASALKAPQPPNMQSSVDRWSQMLTGLFA